MSTVRMCSNNRGRGRYRNRGRNPRGFIDTDTDTDPDADDFISKIRIAVNQHARLDNQGAKQGYFHLSKGCEDRVFAGAWQVDGRGERF